MNIKRQKSTKIDKSEESIVELILALQKIDINSHEAKLNEISISDNNGQRIYL